MPIRVQVIRSSVKGQRPTIGTREPGELYVSFADLQLGVVNAAKTAQDLIAIRFFAATTDYVTGDFVVQAGTVYRAKASITAGAFNASQWDALSTSVDLATKENVIVAGTTADYWRGDKSWVPLTKGAVGLGNVDNTSDASKPVSTATQTALNLKVDKAGDTMSGHLSLPTGPGNANAVRKDYVDSLGTSISGNLALKADIASPTFTGDPKAPTPTAGDNDTSVATTAFVTTAVNTATSGKIGEAPIDGIQYVRQNANWSPVSVPPGTAVSDAPPGSPAAGQLWFESDSGRLFIYYTDANSSQWVQLNGPPVGGGTAEARNRIVNGNGAISQELGDTPTTATTSHIADQWQYHYVGPSVSGSRFTGPVSPDGSLTRMVLNVTVAKSSLAAGDIVQIYQLIEGIRVKDFQWGTASAKQVVLRFMFRSAVAGIYCAAIRNAAYDRSWLGSFNIPTADTNTVVTLVVPGDTTGTWPKDNTHGLNVVFTFACGTTYQGIAGWQAGDKRGIAGMANAASVVSSSSAVTDVGLYLDPNATGVAPPWQMPDYADEYELCERYWQTGPGTAHALVWTQTSWPVRMRAATPAITFSPAISNAQAFAVSYSFSHGTTTAFTFYANARM